jgi:hypothetical protein
MHGGIVKVVVRAITDDDKSRLAVRIRYWGGYHNGLVCCDVDSGNLFVQEPTHPTVEGFRFHALVAGSFAGLKWSEKRFQFFDVSPLLRHRLDEVRAFAWTALRANQLGWDGFVPPGNPGFERLP